MASCCICRSTGVLDSSEKIHKLNLQEQRYIEYQYVGVFMVAFSVLIFLFLGPVEGFRTESQACMYNPFKKWKPALATALFSTVPFVLSVVTSVISGFLGMKIVIANSRTTL
ncbi:pyrophosphate-energized vacuolar membrane proton pump [Spinacia oleracea]|uniref:H(+)-exporting diphosphatase n=1 Tax=Spinacia oleracea TaxID=3562 RepID=A0A9R0IRY3_SPIOL|nr:pyrophosphate-energized vacuolar membrane proton pump-like [Spinacia oleracea]